jgi:hypothetical protein
VIDDIALPYSDERADVIVGMLNAAFRNGFERRSTGDSAEEIMLYFDVLASDSDDSAVSATITSLNRQAMQHGIDACDEQKTLVQGMIEHEKQLREQLKKLVKK